MRGIALVALFLSQQASNGLQALPTELPPPGLYVVLEATGPKLKHDIPVQQQAGFAEHVSYVTNLSRNGSLVLGGPFTPEGAMGPPLGVMLVFRAQNSEAARQLADEDPAVKAGLARVVEVRHFVAAAGAWIPGRQ